MLQALSRACAFAVLLLVVCVGSAIAQKNCVKGIPCGNSCIAATKTCRVGAGSATSATSAATPAAAAIPEGTQFVASSRGTTYYYVGCSGWKSLAVANLRYFKTAAEAKSAGYSPSTQSGCAGPAAAPQPATPAAPAATRTSATTSANSCTIARVIDGDTLDCADGTRVRLLLIDAPEMTQGPFGEVAKLQLQQLAPAGAVFALVHDIDKQDRYGRTLAYLHRADGSMLNEELVRAGVAVVSVYPPNVQHVDRLRAAADSAKAAKRGLWSTTAFECAPADFRAAKCK